MAELPASLPFFLRNLAPLKIAYFLLCRDKNHSAHFLWRIRFLTMEWETKAERSRGPAPGAHLPPVRNSDIPRARPYPRPARAHIRARIPICGNEKESVTY